MNGEHPTYDPAWLCPICMSRGRASRMWYDRGTNVMYCVGDARRGGDLHFLTVEYIVKMLGLPAPLPQEAD